ncbi:hypothetical protein AURDEDRAFT_75779 [Auricularia subglabra TFB-10046 SS5]|uniref:Uncharacterized protein n=1 Tax=Auricularia subglabra (strain TFB-10046 / SS5) TaxID=717982 RepID=J0CWC8_AURST|nr:hypothetical protein AURDEDRAFT_75779 [Auricularia subglabra TFB-10046 SS5]
MTNICEPCVCTTVHQLTENSEYHILEIEFYLLKEGHEDPYTHGADAQKVAGNWYFHKAPTRAGAAASESNSSRAPTAAGGYRGGTRKGLDLTFGGPPDSGAVGGILLRSLRRVSPDGKLISGPSLLVDELLAQSDKANIAALVASWGTLRAFPGTAEGPRMVVESRKDAQLPVYSTPRIGLDLYKAQSPPAADDPRVVFVARPYRYIVQPDILTANGRMQTFVGLYEGLLHDTNPQRALSKACDLSGLKTKTGEDYAQSYRTGRKSGKVVKFVGAKTSNPKAYIEMVGALRPFLTPASDVSAADG